MDLFKTMQGLLLIAVAVGGLVVVLRNSRREKEAKAERTAQNDQVLLAFLNRYGEAAPAFTARARALHTHLTSTAWTIELLRLGVTTDLPPTLRTELKRIVTEDMT